jgi:hypothetical protein
VARLRERQRAVAFVILPRVGHAGGGTGGKTHRSPHAIPLASVTLKTMDAATSYFSEMPCTGSGPS